VTSRFYKHTVDGTGTPSKQDWDQSSQHGSSHPRPHDPSVVSALVDHRNDIYDERVQHSRARTTLVPPSRRHQQSNENHLRPPLPLSPTFYTWKNQSSLPWPWREQATGVDRTGPRWSGGNRQRTLAASHAEIKSGYLGCQMGHMIAQMDASRPWPLVATRNRQGAHRTGRRRRRSPRSVAAAACSFVR